MKIKMSVAQNSLPALSKLAQTTLPAAAAFKVAILVKTLKEPLATFEEKRKTLLLEVGEQDPDKPEQYKIKDLERWNTEMTALGEVETEVGEKMSASELGNANIEPAVLIALDWLIQA